MKDTVVVNIEYPNDHGSSRFEIRNNGTGDQRYGNYDVVAWQTQPDGTQSKMAEFPIKGFTRWLGIEALASLATEIFADAVNTRQKPPVLDSVLPGIVEPEFVQPTREQEIEFLKRCLDTVTKQLDKLTSEGNS